VWAWETTTSNSVSSSLTALCCHFSVSYTDIYIPAVKIAEVCFATRSRNGGIIAVTEMQGILSRKKKVHIADIPIAVNKLKTLGGGFRIIKVGKSDMIVSVPTELDQDHIHVLTLAESGEGGVTVDDIMNQLNWNEDRADRAINLLLKEGMAWQDDYLGISFYWFPSVWKEQQKAQLS
jgi:ESCRT-II complex subunit VPS22